MSDDITLNNPLDYEGINYGVPATYDQFKKLGEIDGNLLDNGEEKFLYYGETIDNSIIKNQIVLKYPMMYGYNFKLSIKKWIKYANAEFEIRFIMTNRSSEDTLSQSDKLFYKKLKEIGQIIYFTIRLDSAGNGSCIRTLPTRKNYKVKQDDNPCYLRLISIYINDEEKTIGEDILKYIYINYKYPLYSKRYIMDMQQLTDDNRNKSLLEHEQIYNVIKNVRLYCDDLLKRDGDLLFLNDISNLPSTDIMNIFYNNEFYAPKPYDNCYILPIQSMDPLNSLNKYMFILGGLPNDAYTEYEIQLIYYYYKDDGYSLSPFAAYCNYDLKYILDTSSYAKCDNTYMVNNLSIHNINTLFRLHGDDKFSYTKGMCIAFDFQNKNSESTINNKYHNHILVDIDDVVKLTFFDTRLNRGKGDTVINPFYWGKEEHIKYYDDDDIQNSNYPIIVIDGEEYLDIKYPKNIFNGINPRLFGYFYNPSLINGEKMYLYVYDEESGIKYTPWSFKDYYDSDKYYYTGSSTLIDYEKGSYLLGFFSIEDSDYNIQKRIDDNKIHIVVKRSDIHNYTEFNTFYFRYTIHLNDGQDHQNYDMSNDHERILALSQEYYYTSTSTPVSQMAVYKEGRWLTNIGYIEDIKNIRCMPRLVLRNVVKISGAYFSFPIHILQYDNIPKSANTTYNNGVMAINKSNITSTNVRFFINVRDLIDVNITDNKLSFVSSIRLSTKKHHTENQIEVDIIRYDIEVTEVNSKYHKCKVIKDSREYITHNVDNVNFSTDYDIDIDDLSFYSALGDLTDDECESPHIYIENQLGFIIYGDGNVTNYDSRIIEI